jgi:hypothetical protein
VGIDVRYTLGLRTVDDFDDPDDIKNKVISIMGTVGFATNRLESWPGRQHARAGDCRPALLLGWPSGKRGSRWFASSQWFHDFFTPVE